MNLVDLFAIVPFFLTIFLNQLEDVQIIGKAGKIVRLIRIMRILRVFKLVRHFAGLQSLIHTMHQVSNSYGYHDATGGVGGTGCPSLFLAIFSHYLR